MAEAIHRYVPAKKAPPPKPSPEETASKEESQKLDSEYKTKRNEALRLRNLRETMLIAKSRHELIPKELVEKQAAFLVVALRQSIMQIPQTHARRILNLTDYSKAKETLSGMMIGLLGDLQDIPAKMIDPAFLKKLVEGDGE